MSSQIDIYKTNSNEGDTPLGLVDYGKFVEKVFTQRISKEGESAFCEDFLIKEERIAFYLNGRKLLSVMSLPIYQDAHILGFLLSEGVIASLRDVKNIEIAKNGKSVFLDADINKESLQHLFHEKTLTSGCCVGVTGNFEGKMVTKFLDSKTQLKLKDLWDSLEIFQTPTPLFKNTGCTHRAMLLFPNRKDFLSAEDIGRHNAIDKVMGLAVLRGMEEKDFLECVLFVTGRLSLEMVIKATMHSIPIIISKAAATHLAINAAQKSGLTLIGFARNNSCNCYTHHARIVK